MTDELILYATCETLYQLRGKVKADAVDRLARYWADRTQLSYTDVLDRIVTCQGVFGTVSLQSSLATSPAQPRDT